MLRNEDTIKRHRKIEWQSSHGRRDDASRGPGDVLDVVVLRDGKEHLKIELQDREKLQPATLRPRLRVKMEPSKIWLPEGPFCSVKWSRRLLYFLRFQAEIPIFQERRFKKGSFLTCFAVKTVIPMRSFCIKIESFPDQ